MPETAARQVKRIRNAADSLDIMPMRFRLYDDAPPKYDGMRMLPVDNYVILYHLNEAGNVVEVVRVLYGGSDIARNLGVSGDIRCGRR